MRPTKNKPKKDKKNKFVVLNLISSLRVLC